LIGNSALSLVAGIWVKSLTGSSAEAGLVSVCIYAPSLAGPLAGVLADRARRRRLLLALNVVSAVILLPLLAVHGWRADVLAGFNRVRRTVELRRQVIVGAIVIGVSGARRGCPMQPRPGVTRAPSFLGVLSAALGSQAIGYVSYQTVYIGSAALAFAAVLPRLTSEALSRRAAH
jgi:MFS family permease